MALVNFMEWIERELKPRQVSSVELIYDEMDSQSRRCLPVIYQPFDPDKRSHWCDRGSILDFLCVCGKGALLDFGPGDGWPSLLAAPFVEQVTGVDASARRVEVCTENAARLGIDNATFTQVPAGSPLPFLDDSFDGIMAASSVEQTPDPEVTLRELCRVLKPGGRLRLLYESLSGYAGGKERELALWPLSDTRCKLLGYDRDIGGETAYQYSITIALPLEDARTQLGLNKDTLQPGNVGDNGLASIRDSMSDPRKCTLRHPSAKTYVRMLTRIGFREILPTQSGSDTAGQTFDKLAADQRPGDMAGVDALLRPLIDVATKLPSPASADPMLTAIK